MERRLCLHFTKNFTRLCVKYLFILFIVCKILAKLNYIVNIFLLIYY